MSARYTYPQVETAKAEAQGLGQRQGTAAERARCAALCREAGCICLDDYGRPRPGFDAYCKYTSRDSATPNGLETIEKWVVEIHDPRCPDALAAGIEALAIGKEK